MKRAFRIDARVREVIYAGLVAFTLLLGTITGPIDQFIWTVQARLSSFEASGDIVFVGVERNLANPAFPERRRALADALANLASSGAERVYVDAVFDERSTSDADTALRSAMEQLGDRLYLVQSYETALDGRVHPRRSIPEIGEGIQQVGKNYYINYFGHVWKMPSTMAPYGSPLVNLPVSMAGRESSVEEEFSVNYSFELSSIPMLDLAELGSSEANEAELQRLDGRVVLIGNANLSARNTVNVPGHIDVPSSLVQIYAAETLRAGLTAHLGGFAILAICVAILGLSLALPPRRWNRLAFGLVAAGLPALVLAASAFGARVDVAASVAFLAMYSLLRGRRLWRDRLNLEDPATRLPTFAALAASKTAAREQLAIVVGKIHRLEDVKRTLPEELHGEYVKRIVERLRLKSDDQVFYVGHGHCLAWCLPERDPLLLKEHLEGLRALLSAPLRVGNELVDASMTFSVDTSPSQNVAKRLAAAVAAVEQTTEAYNPIAATQIESEEDLLWNISLQARIDAALDQEEIYLVYQPKILIETGDVVGVEALVRWNDPARGQIPPDVFIRQCESAGRMLHLTRHVLREACKAGNVFELHGRPLPVAVNISATLLRDREVVAVVREVLDETSFDARRLTLEVTETYRISDLQTAGQVLTELSALGLKVSMDDFGVGAASFEALLNLPFGELKIDRLFVSQIVDNAKARGIVDHVLKLGRDLRIIVVAEGIEDAATLAMLKKLGCVVGQGFGIAEPMPAEEIAGFRRSRSGARLQRS